MLSPAPQMTAKTSAGVSTRTSRVSLTRGTPLTQTSKGSRVVLRKPSLQTKCSVADTASSKSKEPVLEVTSAFSPATVANLGPGFDFLGCAVEGQGDTVTARLLPDRPGEVVIEDIQGDGGRLSYEAADNCSGIAAIETLKLLGVSDMGIGISLNKGLPLGSGLGSSAASAGAAAWAVNALYGCPLSKAELVPAGLVSEAYVSGYHADNIAPAIMGGFVLIREYEPELLLERLEFGGNSPLWFVVVTPKFEAPTREMRAALPKDVSMAQMTLNATAAASLVTGIMSGDAAMLGKGLNSDSVIEPARGPLIPGFFDVKKAAIENGAFGCTISGAGPTVVAIVDSKDNGVKVAEAMINAFGTKGNLEVNCAAVVQLSTDGAHSCEPDYCAVSDSAVFVK
eukprot:CAMPEP_0197844012 /NCGR_PEP_ID=MMETSP1438-20131217/978_1 /TAXON_ID=1461541 /ORGANISM="Pterosperma sp., Strain CCMP1384" /LENGTH=396 /DNA_ID=CAMNT_0043454537 /DNA_START=463 /DNA_END=1653 /DNA_ORIENTATION=+